MSPAPQYPAMTPPQIDAANAALDQTLDAERELHRPLADYLHLPWPALHDLVGLIAPGNIWMVTAFSGRGKTTFLTSLVRRWLAEGVRVYYMGLESRPLVIRTYFAAYDKGYAPGDLLSGAAKQWAHYASVRAELRQALSAQYYGMRGDYPLHVSQHERISAAQLGGAFVEAKDVGARVMVIDHIDHIQADEPSAYQASRRVVDTMDDLAKRYEMPVLVASQLNNDVMRGDPMAQLRPPQPHHVYMGGHKRHIATGMLGLYRPVRSDVTADELKAVRAGDRDALELTEPDTMGVVCMKHRWYGNREGKRAALGVDRGRVIDMPERDRHSTTYDGVRAI